MKKAFLLVVLVVFSAVCLLSLVSCGKSEAYGEVAFKLKTTISPVGIDDETIEEQVFNTVFPSYFGGGNKTTASIKDIKYAPKEVKYIEGYESVEHAVVVDKWVYFNIIQNDSGSGEENTRIFNLEPEEFKRLIKVAENDADCVQKYILNIGAYVFQNKDFEYFGKSVKEANATERENNSQSVNALGISEKVIEELKQEQPEFMKVFYANGAMVSATLAYYDFIDISKVEKGVGKLMINYNKKNITLNVVGYYESEADKMLEKAVSMDKESKEYKTVLEQLQNPVFYSVCGNFLE